MLTFTLIKYSKFFKNVVFEPWPWRVSLRMGLRSSSRLLWFFVKIVIFVFIENYGESLIDWRVDSPYEKLLSSGLNSFNDFEKRLFQRKTYFKYLRRKRLPSKGWKIRELEKMKFWQRFGKLVSCGRVDDSNQSLDSHIKEHFLKFKRIRVKMDGPENKRCSDVPWAINLVDG